MSVQELKPSSGRKHPEAATSSVIQLTFVDIAGSIISTYSQWKDSSCSWLAPALLQLEPSAWRQQARRHCIAITLDGGQALVNVLYS